MLSQRFCIYDPEPELQAWLKHCRFFWRNLVSVTQGCKQFYLLVRSWVMLLTVTKFGLSFHRWGKTCDQCVCVDRSLKYIWNLLRSAAGVQFNQLYPGGLEYDAGSQVHDDLLCMFSWRTVSCSPATSSANLLAAE